VSGLPDEIIRAFEDIHEKFAALAWNFDFGQAIKMLPSAVESRIGKEFWQGK
jgi:hypothetical protein